MALRGARLVRFQDYVGLGSLTTSVALPQHAHQHSPERPVLLAVDQQLREGATLRVAQNSPIRSARSKSGSMRTWSSSARGPNQGHLDVPGVGALAHRDARSQTTHVARVGDAGVFAFKDVIGAVDDGASFHAADACLAQATTRLARWHMQGSRFGPWIGHRPRTHGTTALPSHTKS